jgi:hypothetical protein
MVIRVQLKAVVWIVGLIYVGPIGKTAGSMESTMRSVPS